MSATFESPLPTGLPPTSSQEGDGTGGIIPYKNPNALLAYYFGVFSLIPGIGLFLAIAALWLGISGLKCAKENPVVKGKVHAWIGIVCGSFWLLVYAAVVVFLLLFTISNH